MKNLVDKYINKNYNQHHVSNNSILNYNKEKTQNENRCVSKEKKTKPILKPLKKNLIIDKLEDKVKQLKEKKTLKFKYEKLMGKDIEIDEYFKNSIFSNIKSSKSENKINDCYKKSQLSLQENASKNSSASHTNYTSSTNIHHEVETECNYGFNENYKISPSQEKIKEKEEDLKSKIKERDLQSNESSTLVYRNPSKHKKDNDVFSMVRVAKTSVNIKKDKDKDKEKNEEEKPKKPEKIKGKRSISCFSFIC